MKTIVAPHIAKPTVDECQPQGVSANIQRSMQGFITVNFTFIITIQWTVLSVGLVITLRHKIYRMNADLGVDWETQVQGYPTFNAYNSAT